MKRVTSLGAAPAAIGSGAALAQTTVRPSPFGVALLCTAVLVVPAHGALTTGDVIPARPERLAPEITLPAPLRSMPVESFRLLDVTAAPTLADRPRPAPRQVTCASLAAEDCYAATWTEALASRAREAMETPWLAAAPIGLFGLAAVARARRRRARSA